ncbi:MAG: energy coupling factor transporter S component ThiW [Nitrososphaerota archaeon]|nr:energy coupling factor transporter S component ThiW [Candidatus Calditenuaceae archaeon]MDW8073072.1 energy coupling factor transporter S component ThiW [Nitrososphaerota archaeon]
MKSSRKITYVMAISAVTLISSLYIWFPFLGTRAAPMQHFGNVLAGVMVGPLWGLAVPLIVGSLRIGLGLGTLFAYPGGIPGVILVGLFYKLTGRFRDPRARFLCAFVEPVGTVLLGGTVSLLILFPFLPDLFPLSPSLSALLARGEYFLALLIFWSGWAASSVPGAIAGYLVLIALHKVMPQIFRRD